MTINLSKALKAFQQRQARYLPSGGRAVASAGRNGGCVEGGGSGWPAGWGQWV